MSYVAESLDEIAKLFEEHADHARAQVAKVTAQRDKAAYVGEAAGWAGAAYILRRTTLKENAQ